MALVRSTAKGQILIPANIRRRFNIRKGTSLNIYADGERIYIEPLPDDPVSRDRGMLGTGGRVLRALMEDRRGQAK